MTRRYAAVAGDHPHRAGNPHGMVRVLDVTHPGVSGLVAYAPPAQAEVIARLLNAEEGDDE